MNAFIQAIIGSAISGIGILVMIIGFSIATRETDLFFKLIAKERIILASIFFALAFIVTLGVTGLKAVDDWAKEYIRNDQHPK